MKYFKQFPTINYKYSKSNGDIGLVELSDLNYKFSLRDAVRDSAETMYSYRWKEGDRIDILADMYYDDVNLYWLVMLSNDYFDSVNDFPLKNSVFEDYLYRKYRQDAIAAGYTDDEDGVIRYTTQAIWEYRDDDNFVIDLETYRNQSGGRIMHIFDIENEKNEEKRKIKLVDKEISGQIENELEKSFNKIKKENV